MIARLLKSCSSLLFNFCLFLVIAIFLLLGTPLGIKLGYYLALPYLPQSMSLEGLSGSILTGITLEQFNYSLPEQHIHLDNALVQCQFRLFSNTLSCQKIYIEHIRIQQTGTSPQSDEPFTLAAIQLPEINLPIQIKIHEFRIKQLEWITPEQTQTINPIVIALQAEESTIELQSLFIHHPQAHITAQGQLQLKQAYPLTLNYDVTLLRENAAPLQLHSELSGDLNQLHWQITTPTIADTQFTLQLDNALIAQPHLSINAQWKELSALIGDYFDIHVQQGSFSLEADLQHYQLNLDSQFWHTRYHGIQVQSKIQGNTPYQQAPSAHFNAQVQSQLPNLHTPKQTHPINMKLDGKWQDNRLTLNPSQLQWGDNQVKLQANLDLAQQLIHEASVSLNITSPQQIYSPIQGRLNGDCHASGALLTPIYTCSLSAQQLSYLTYMIDGLQLKAQGKGQLEAAQSIQLDASGIKIDAYKIASLQLNAQGDKNPKHAKQIQLQIHDLVAAGQKVTNLKLHGHGQLDDFSLQLRADDLHINAQPVKSIELGLLGSLEQHTLNASLIQDQNNTLSFALSGNYALAKQSWQGNLNRLQLHSPSLNDWALSKPSRSIQVQLTPLRIDLPQICFNHQQTSLCLLANLINQEWRSALDLIQLDFADYMPHPSSNIDLKGGLSLTLQAQGDMLGINDAQLDVKLQPGLIRFHDMMEGSKTVTVDILAGVIQARLSENQLNATGRVQLGQDQTLDINAQLSQLSHGLPSEQTLIEAKTHLELHQFDWLAQLTPEISEPKINLSSQLQATGSLFSPDLSGHISLVDSSLQIPLLGIYPKFNLTASAKKIDDIQLDGRIQSADGTINLKGLLDLTDWQPKMELNISGDQFKAIKTETFDVELSPNLALQLNPEQIKITGELSVPKASIEIKELPESAVSLSNDVVVVDAPSANNNTLPIASNITLKLGPKVNFKGFGLTTGIKGQIKVQEKPNKVAKGSGNLQLVKGRYKAYGQDLTIRKGQLNFVGPLDNPGLDFLAIRVVDDVTAGLKVQGTLKKPILNLYSDPLLENSDIMSYIVLGRPLSKTQSSEEGNQLAGAALSMGVEGANYLSQQITTKLGLPAVQLNVEGRGDEQQVDVGTYLTPSLYISYGQKVFEKDPTQRNSWKLRYQINPKLALESTTTDSTFIDLIYEIETDTELKKKFNYTPDSATQEKQ